MFRADARAWWSPWYKDAQLLAKPVQLLGSRETQPCCSETLGALLTGPLRSEVKEKEVSGAGSRGIPTCFLFMVSQVARPSLSTLPRPSSPLERTCGRAWLTRTPLRKHCRGGDSYAAVQMRGWPYRTTVPGFRKFLGLHCDSLKGEQAVQLVLNRDGRPSGLARVQFDTPATASCASNGRQWSRGA